MATLGMISTIFILYITTTVGQNCSSDYGPIVPVCSNSSSNNSTVYLSGVSDGSSGAVCNCFIKSTDDEEHVIQFTRVTVFQGCQYQLNIYQENVHNEYNYTCGNYDIFDKNYTISQQRSLYLELQHGLFYNQSGGLEFCFKIESLSPNVGLTCYTSTATPSPSPSIPPMSPRTPGNEEVCMVTTVNASFSGEDKDYQVPQTRLGDNWHSNETCLVDGVHMMKLMCMDTVYGAFWSDPIIHLCNFDKEPKSAVTDELEEIDKDANLDTEDILKVFNLTSDSENLAPLDIIYTSSILNRVSNSSNTISNTDAITFVGIVNNLQNVPTEILQDAVRQGNVSNRLISSIENMELRLLTNDDDDDDDTKAQIVTNNVIVAVWNLQDNTENPIIGLTLNGKTSEPTIVFDSDALSSLYKYNEQDVIHATTDVGIVLNRTFVRNIIQERNLTDVRLAFHVLTNSQLFTADGKQHSVNSKIISATLTVDKQPITDLNGSVITTIFYPKKVIEDAYRANYSICAYWDLSLRNYKGGWSSKGCLYSRNFEGRDICTCDHLTNFAILLDYYGQNHLVSAHHQLWLSIITIIGLVLSIAGLSLTVISFILFSKLRQGLPQQTLVNLALAMLCSWIVFLAGVNKTESYIGCLAVAVLLHYFIMASFMWMLMEGFLQYLLFVKVFPVYVHKHMLKTTIVAWGVPLIPVCTMLGIDVQLYDGGEIYCWMSLTGFYFGFAVPVGLIILSNIVIYTLFTYKICSRKKFNTSLNSNTTVTNIRISFCSFILLGCSWVFGFLAISDARVVFQYIFTILNSLQGFFIFLLFTLRNQKVRDYWRNLCCKATCTPPGKSTSSTNKNEIKLSDMTEDK